MTRAELEAIAKELDTPIDFGALIKTGVLEKRGAWYRVVQFNKLPSHATRKVKTIKFDEKGETFLKFYKVSSKP
jgi:hypothetical protein